MKGDSAGTGQVIDDLTATAVHEAGHAVVNCLVGRKLVVVTARSGATFAGCTGYSYVEPPAAELATVVTGAAAPLLPAGVRAFAEADVMALAAGGVAEDLFRMGTPGRRPESLRSRLDAVPSSHLASIPLRHPDVLAEMEASDRQLPSASTTEELAWLRSDDGSIWARALWINGGDFTAASDYSRWLISVTERLVRGHLDVIETIAGHLLRQGELSGQAAEALIEQEIARR